MAEGEKRIRERRRWDSIRRERREVGRSKYRAISGRGGGNLWKIWECKRLAKRGRGRERRGERSKEEGERGR